MRLSGSPWRPATDIGVAVALTVAVLVIAWAYRAVLVTSDPWHYVQSALYFGEHEWIPAGLTRWGIILPLVGVAAVFGDTLPTYYAFALLATALVVPVVYVLARWVGGVWAAVLTVVTLVAMPLTFVNLTRGYPDLMAVALNGLTLILVLRARDTGRVWLLALAGLVAGWAFEVRETTIFTWPLFAWVIWGMARRWRGYALVLLGLLPWALLDIGLSWATLGDPWAKWNVLSGSDLNDSTSVLDGAYLGHDRWWYLARLPAAMLEQPWGWTVLLVAVLGIVGGIVLRGRVGLYVVWAVLPMVLLMLQAGVLDPAHPSVRVDVPRYWLAFTPGLTIAAVALLGWLSARLGWPRLIGPVALAALMVAVGVRYATTEPTFRPNAGDLPYEVAEQLPGGSVVWTDGRTLRILPVYAEDDVQFRDFTLRGAAPQPGEYVLVFSDTDTTCEFCKLDYDLWLDTNRRLPVNDYRLVWSAEDGRARLYEVAGD